MTHVSRVGGVLVLVLALAAYAYVDVSGLRCIVAARDGKRYCVRERPKMELAANKLAETADKMSQVVQYLRRHRPKDARTQRLVARFDPTVIQETVRSSKLEAYSENKGEHVAFCLNKHHKTDDADRLVDTHTLTFVALHELAHLATREEGHPRTFWECFRWILDAAREAGIHAPVDYKRNPEMYCGMVIDDNPYFDLN